jgi:threonine aldolase
MPHRYGQIRLAALRWTVLLGPAGRSPRLVGMTQRKSFGSDNHAGAHPAVLRAIMDANSGDAVAYGADERTEEVTAALRDTFGAAGGAFLALNGSGANVLGLSVLLRRHEAVICAESAHINTDECGSAERLLGTKLLTVPAPGGKITAELIAEQLSGRGDDHRAQPGVVAVTQSTELGTCYTLAELAKIADFCRASDLRLYLDGARLANAAAYLDCSLAELAECADVLSFGGTKNGAMGVEALIVMRPGLAEDVPYLRKQQTQLASKMRFLAAQFDALLHDDLWRANASHANAMARRLAEGAAAVGVGIVHPVQANAVFARLHPRHIAALQQDWFFHVWDEAESVVRWMAAFDTTESDVDAFLADIRATAEVSSTVSSA